MAKKCTTSDPETWLTDLHQQILGAYGEAEEALTLPLVRKIFLLLTRLHFSDANHFGQLKENLQKLVYKQSKLEIELSDTHQPDKDKNNEAIYVSVTGMVARNVALGDIGPDHPEENDLSTENLVYKGQSTVRIYCIHPSPDISAFMAHSLFDFFVATGLIIRRSLGLLEYQLTGLGMTREARFAPAGAFEHVLTINIGAEYSTTVRWETHRVKRVVFDLFGEL